MISRAAVRLPSPVQAVELALDALLHQKIDGLMGRLHLEGVGLRGPSRQGGRPARLTHEQLRAHHVCSCLLMGVEP